MQKRLFTIISTLFCSSAFSHGIDIEQIEVVGQQTRLNGEAISASYGVISQQEIEQRPLLRTGEVLEFVPGMVVTQHSGSGKANQYFLRGFNLDHGADFGVYVNSMPVNMRSHGHGQGYTDLNFIIPELIGHMEYQKGAYNALQGDFSTAGSSHFHVTRELAQNFVSFELGQDNHQRFVGGADVALNGGTLLVGAELHRYDGPWSDISEDIDKTNALLQFSGKTTGTAYSITAMAYDNSWNSADQIPQRAVSQGMINALGSIDTSLGGESSRYSLSANLATEKWHASAYIIDSSLDLFSNFTYFLNSPDNSDQFKQVDSRTIYGTDVSYHFDTDGPFLDWLHTIGVQYRYDDIDEVGLFNTNNRTVIDTVRQDSIEQYSASVFYQSDIMISARTQLRAGVRYDYMNVDVASDNAANSGRDSDGIVSLSLGTSYYFSPAFEGYINAGQSFHSNDARGATITRDPLTNEMVDKVDLLVRGDTAEIGLRYFDADALNVSISLWWLALDSELVFVGDAGNTEASGASERYGLELSAFYWLGDTLSLDSEVALSHSRYKNVATGEGDRIEGSIGRVVSLGANWRINEKWQSSLRLRHFGPRTLDAFGERKSDALNVVNWQLGYSNLNWKIRLQILNLFDSDDHDIDYLYESRLANEIEAVEDVHFHPIEPRTTRVSATYLF